MYEEIIIVTLVAFTIVGLYGLGSLINRWIANKHLKKVWNQLRKIGAEGEFRTLGSSGFIITLEKPTQTIKRIDVSLVLEKRDFPLNWLIDRLRGKRDTLTIGILYKNLFLPKRVEIFRRGNYFGDSLYKYRNNLKELGNIYLNPSEMINNKKVRKLINLIDKYKGIYFISYKKDRNMLVLGSSTNEVNSLNKIIHYLFSL